MINVIGDIILDRWVIGSVDRISPEAPVPVLLKQKEECSLGGASNVAANLSNLISEVKLYGELALDVSSDEVLELTKEHGIQCRISHSLNVTPVKTRFVGNEGQHILRLDVEIPNSKNRQIETPTEKILKDISVGDIVIVSDYNKGSIEKDTVQKISDITDLIFVDPKQEPEIYNSAFLVKPNMKEYLKWNGEFTTDSAIQFMNKHNWTWLVLTDGANGMHVLKHSGEYHHYVESTREVCDVSGAGDTVLSVIVYAHNNGMTIPQSCELACYAASRIVERRGVSLVTIEDLNRGIVWTNGVFDVLHSGHLELLEFSKNHGKKLIVGINDDESVRRLKGKHRPINDVLTRKRQLEILPWVDEVIIFKEETPQNIIEKIRPDVIIKGGDYTTETTVGNEVSKVIIFPSVEEYSTTSIIEKINGVKT
tara:strand:- start:44 stop:1315 length:1272 start_codon:yes stop_codon:yes gene_type:complete